MNRTLLRSRRWVLSVLLITLGCNALKADVVITAETETSVRTADITDIAFEGDFRTGSLLVNYADGTTLGKGLSTFSLNSLPNAVYVLNVNGHE